MKNKNNVIVEMIDALAQFNMCKNDEFYLDDEEEEEALTRYRNHASIVIDADKKNEFKGIKGAIKIELRKVEQLKNKLVDLEALIKVYNESE